MIDLAECLPSPAWGLRRRPPFLKDVFVHQTGPIPEGTAVYIRSPS